MYDPAILIAVLDDIEQKTKGGSVSRKKLNPSGDRQYSRALDYLMEGYFVEWSVGHHPAVFFRLSKEGEKLRYELREGLDQAAKATETEKKQQRRAVVDRFLVLAGVLVAVAALFSQCVRFGGQSAEETVLPDIPVEKISPATAEQTNAVEPSIVDHGDQ